MTVPATPQPPIDAELLDQLVPRPGPRGRRWAAWLVFLALTASVTVAFTSGTVTPLVRDTGVVSWGGAGPVQIGVRLTNDSRVAIEVVGGPRARPGLRLLGYSRDVESPDYVADPFPLRLEPDTALVLTVWFEVQDCAEVAGTPGDDDRLDLQLRIADGPFGTVTRTRSIPTDDLFIDQPGSTDVDPADVSWPRAIAQYACPGQ